MSFNLMATQKQTSTLILTGAIEVVLTLFAAFGTSLRNVLPDVIEQKEFIYNMTQWICLAIFLFIKVLVFVWSKQNKLGVMIVFIGSFILLISSSWLYYDHTQNHLKKIECLEGETVITGELTPESIRTCTENKGIILEGTSCEDFLLSDRTSGDYMRIWDPDSIKHNTDLFVIFYVVLVMSLSVCIFSLVEFIPIIKRNNAA